MERIRRNRFRLFYIKDSGEDGKDIILAGNWDSVFVLGWDDFPSPWTFVSPINVLRSVISVRASDGWKKTDVPPRRLDKYVDSFPKRNLKATLTAKLFLGKEFSYQFGKSSKVADSEKLKKTI